MSRATVTEPVVLEGIGPHEGRACSAAVHPAPFGSGLVFRTEDEAIAAVGENLEGGDGLVFYGETSEVAGVEALLAALLVAGITDARIDVIGGEIPVSTLGTWLQRLRTTEGPAWTAPALDEARFVSGDEGYAALVPAEAAVAVRLDDGPGKTGEGLLPLDGALLAAELGSARRVHFDLEDAHAEGRWLGLGPENCATSAAELACPDEGLRWHMVCALAGLAVAGVSARLELVGADLEPLARVVRTAE
ncbi:MAG: hypothetical protein EP330_29010 [Deltaproteobacteria bacterium]|nr:MAG: hypothetical protein EP330_29010 [Deltaproteobacteria bacterium]